MSGHAWRDGKRDGDDRRLQQKLQKTAASGAANHQCLHRGRRGYFHSVPWKTQQIPRAEHTQCAYYCVGGQPCGGGVRVFEAASHKLVGGYTTHCRIFAGLSHSCGLSELLTLSPLETSYHSTPSLVLVVNPGCNRVELQVDVR